MIEPTTYAEWSNCIDIFETGEQDDAVLIAMSSGTLNWNSGVATLFSERISGAFNTRLQRCADRMERAFKTGCDETTVVRAILDTRRTLTLLHRVATIPSFPDMLRQHLTGEIRRYAERAQQSLEDSAKHDRSGRLATLLRNNSLLRYEPTPDANAPEASSAPKVPEVNVVQAIEAPLPDESVTSNAGAIYTRKALLIVAAAVTAICLVVGVAWFARHDRDSESSQMPVLVKPVPTAPATAKTMAATLPSDAIQTKTLETATTPTTSTKIVSLSKSVPSDPDETVHVATISQPPNSTSQQTRTPHKRTNDPSKGATSITSILASIIDEGERCFNENRFDCAIGAANSALRLDSSNSKAVDLKRRAEVEQKRALDSISIN